MPRPMSSAQFQANLQDLATYYHAQATKTKKPDDYTSEGVRDHDIFLLPGTDYQVMIFVTVLAATVRLFRIYQPSSVVFDEVQYVLLL